MQQIYPTFPSGDLKSNANEAFKLADQGPLVIMNRTVPRAVLVGAELWNETAKELQRLRALHNAMMDRRSAEIDAGNYMTQEQVENELGL